MAIQRTPVVRWSLTSVEDAVTCVAKPPPPVLGIAAGMGAAVAVLPVEGDATGAVAPAVDAGVAFAAALAGTPTRGSVAEIGAVVSVAPVTVLPETGAFPVTPCPFGAAATTLPVSGPAGWAATGWITTGCTGTGWTITGRTGIGRAATGWAATGCAATGCAGAGCAAGGCPTGGGPAGGCAAGGCPTGGGPAGGCPAGGCGGVDVAVEVGVPVAGVAVGVFVGVVVGVAVGVFVGVLVGVVAHALGVNRLLSNVTAPLRANARPATVAPVFTVMLVSARMFPTNAVLVPSVAELPTCQ